MSKKLVVPSQVEEESTQYHLYRVTCRRSPTDGLGSRTKTFITFGTSEDDAKERIWQAYAGSSFAAEYSQEMAAADVILGKVMKLGG